MARPCANPFCDEQLPDDAQRDKRYCDDNTCGREARRIRRNKNRARDVHRAERFWRGLGRIRRLAPGQATKRGTPRHTSPQTHQEVTA